MSHLQELDVVRVVRLHRQDRGFTGTESVMRPPRIGDVGAIVGVYGEADDTPVAVEMVDSDGLTVWLADFERTELELVQAYSDRG